MARINFMATLFSMYGSTYPQRLPFLMAEIEAEIAAGTLPSPDGKARDAMMEALRRIVSEPHADALRQAFLRAEAAKAAQQ